MITLFTTAKPFVGQARVAQMNALGSWKHLHPEAEVILFGKTEGATEIADALGLVYVPDVETNEFGTPLISAMFEKAHHYGRFDLQAYVNCDIILLEDFLPALSHVSLERFVVAGRRWNIDLDEALNFDSDWRGYIRQIIHQRGTRHPPAGSDYFVYPRGLWHDIPPFAVGRPGWDNWMIYRCLADGIPVVDASRAIIVVHQNHRAVYTSMDAPSGQLTDLEVERNLSLITPFDTGRRLTLVHAKWVLSPRGLRPKKSLRHRINSFIILPIVNPRYAWLSGLSEFVRFSLKIVDKRLNARKWLPEETP